MTAPRLREQRRPPAPPDCLPSRPGGHPSPSTASAAGPLAALARYALEAVACLGLTGALALPVAAQTVPAPQDFQGRPLLPGQIRLSWWRNIDAAGYDLIDRYEYIYRLYPDGTFPAGWTTVNQTALPGTTEVRNYNSVLLTGLGKGMDYIFWVRSVDKDGGTSAAVAWLETAIGRQTFSIEADRPSEEEGSYLYLTLSRDQRRPNVLMVLQLIEEKPNITRLPLPQQRAMREEWAREAWAHFFGRWPPNP